MTEKFKETFSKFAPALSSEEIQKEVERIVEKHASELDTKETVKLLHSCVDLTTLTSEDNEDSVYAFVEQVNKLDDERPDIPHVAAICVYPNFVATVKEALRVEGVRIAAVSGAFPSSQTFMEVKVVETGLALTDGADEIDIVLHVGDFLNGDYQSVVDQIMELRDVTKGKKLKVILETGALKTPENIRKASILSLYSDADFLKTSTGKEYPGASLEAAYVMAKVLKEYYDKFGYRRGLKVSGGVRTTEDAIKYLSIVKEILGEEWMTPEFFRIGASSIVKDLQKHIGE